MYLALKSAFVLLNATMVLMVTGRHTIRRKDSQQRETDLTNTEVNRGRERERQCKSESEKERMSKNTPEDKSKTDVALKSAFVVFEGGRINFFIRN